MDECKPLGVGLPVDFDPGRGGVDGRGGRVLHSFRFQLNLSSSVHRVTQLNPECVLELLKLSSNVNECKPLGGGAAAGGGRGRRQRGRHRRCQRGSASGGSSGGAKAI